MKEFQTITNFIMQRLQYFQCILYHSDTLMRGSVPDHSDHVSGIKP